MGALWAPALNCCAPCLAPLGLGKPGSNTLPWRAPTSPSVTVALRLQCLKFLFNIKLQGEASN
ncbi:hypothetical protein CC1G_15257 [Coprinopsis cinerea okayama7|uniref:Uncharacterized protein n=1 Tax=Coprinopsis cinerea (strain Okayama-7 / 130 / ATCC MYA-4618 / FGSC 9003) TaxID=240176 RepID=D6RPV6_COPC7|nr:hypothetical protein CC1G_15257 [Coprinopsis cinerea okayama7\|eukprot:XP_002910349.1 hypothetical protein CC1G_15257 [Coprinopsis cinerea okayama7\